MSLNNGGGWGWGGGMMIRVSLLDPLLLHNARATAQRVGARREEEQEGGVGGGGRVLFYLRENMPAKYGGGRGIIGPTVP